MFYPLYKEFTFAMEYPDCLTTLREMTCLGEVSGMKPDDVFQEAYKFKEVAEKVIDSMPGMTNKIKFVYYDGRFIVC